MSNAPFLRSFLFLFLTLYVNLFLAQQTFLPSVLVTYEKRSVESMKENTMPEVTHHVLIANETTAVFKALSAFKYDSIKQTGGDERMLMSNFDLREQANLLVTANEFYFSDLVMNSEIMYKERNAVTWNVKDEFDNVAGVECQKATTSLYGRDWTACFSPDIPIPFGPYKFNNLPGLILQVYDSDNQYNFKVVEIKKYKSNYKVDRFSNAKQFSKPDFLKVKENLESDFTLGGKIKFKPEELRKFTENRNNRLKFKNPLERIP